MLQIGFAISPLSSKSLVSDDRCFLHTSMKPTSTLIWIFSMSLKSQPWSPPNGNHDWRATTKRFGCHWPPLQEYYDWAPLLQFHDCFCWWWSTWLLEASSLFLFCSHPTFRQESSSNPPNQMVQRSLPISPPKVLSGLSVLLHHSCLSCIIN